MSILQSALCNGIKTIYEDAQMSDSIIKARNTEIHAHKVVLAAHSASFKPCFRQAMFQASAVSVSMPWVSFLCIVAF